MCGRRYRSNDDLKELILSFLGREYLMGIEFEKFDKLVDARGKRCPIPAVMAKIAIDDCEPGTVILVLSEDKGSLQDVPREAQKNNAQVLGVLEENGLCRILIRKAE